MSERHFGETPDDWASREVRQIAKDWSEPRTTPETIRISLPGLTTAETDRLRQIQKEVAERPSDENAMESACGEYNCPCHYQIRFLLEVIARTTTISLPALRAVLFEILDSGDPYLYRLFISVGDKAMTARIELADRLCERLCQLMERSREV